MQQVRGTLESEAQSMLEAFGFESGQAQCGSLFAKTLLFIT